MLVLSRKIGQRIYIGDNIAVTVVQIGRGGVRLGIEAPDDFAVIREELKSGQKDTASEKAAEKSRLGAPK